MKVYIQEIETGRYFKNPFVWVDDKAAAYNFVTSLEAFDFCLQMNHGRGTRILLSFENPGQDICLFSFEAECSKTPIETAPAEQDVPVAPMEREPELVGVG